jgi:single-stranded DNA-binding protein
MNASKQAVNNAKRNAIAYENYVRLVGVVASEPHACAGRKLVMIPLTVNRYWKPKGSKKIEIITQSHSIACWGKLAKVASDLVQGDHVKIEGQLQARSWPEVCAKTITKLKKRAA